MTHASSRDAGRERLARVGVVPRGLDRLEAAAYVGVSPQTFDALISDAIMPGAREVRGRRVWDRLELDRAFDALPHAGGMATAIDPDDVWSRARA
jgi:hypothetical protein